MNKIAKFFLAITTGMIFFAGCSQIFETSPDVQARKALKDLMAIQEDFLGKNQRYARNLVEIEDYDLNYHTGIVYLEIEKAGKDSYRAISLPAESTTARVFAYDTEKGGFYEMDVEEVSQYVLGALNFIRKEQREKSIINLMSVAFLVVLLAFGVKSSRQSKEKGTHLIALGFFGSLIPLGWSLAILNHMNDDIVPGTWLMGGIIGSLVLVVLCFILNAVGFNQILKTNVAPALGRFISTIFLTLFSGWVMVKNLLHFYGQ